MGKKTPKNSGGKVSKHKSVPGKVSYSGGDNRKAKTSAKTKSQKTTPSYSVRMANPNANKRGRNKRHGNPDLSDADSLPSDSDELDSDADLPSAKSEKAVSGKTADDSDSDVEQYLNEEDAEEEKPTGKISRFADDSSDSEEEHEEEEDSSAIRVTTKLVAEWGKALQTNPSAANLKTAIRAFLAAVAQISGQKKKSPYIVEGGTAFNAVVSMCIRLVGPALLKLLKVSANAKPKEKMNQLKKNKKWKVLHVPVRSYLTGLTELATRLHDVAVVRRVLKHIMELLPYYSCNPKASKMLFKHLVQLWSTGKEEVRLSAFVTLLKFLRISDEEWILPAIKKMYVAYVSNSKQTNATTWPVIGFMASSLVEVMSISPQIAYQQAFVYIRQMAIHVRNATNQKNKETQAKVYNWPFMHCIYLWSKLVSDVYPNAVLFPLVHPLVQIITSTIKINPVRKFYPLVFHCVRALNIISAKTDIFIPVIPIILNTLHAQDLNKKPKSTSMKPFEFFSMVKFSDSQLMESNYRTGIAEQAHELLMDYLKTQCCRIGFPELISVPAIQLRRFLKDCKVGEVAKKFKQLLGLMEEQSNFVSESRKNVQFKFTDGAAVTVWEKSLSSENSPFMKAYTSWKQSKKNVKDSIQAALEGKVNTKQKRMQIDVDEEYDSDKDESAEFKEDFWADAEDAEESQSERKQNVTDGKDIVTVMGSLSDDEDDDEEASDDESD